MTMCGPHTYESTNIIYPNDSYMICIECYVAESSLLQWSFHSLDAARFTLSHTEGDVINRGPVTLTLTKNADVSGRNVFKSLLQVPSSNISDILESPGGTTKISCQISETEKDEIILFMSGILFYCYRPIIIKNFMQMKVNQKLPQLVSMEKPMN